MKLPSRKVLLVGWDAADRRVIRPFAVRLFLSCQAMAKVEEMRLVVVEELGGRRGNLLVTEYLRAQVLSAEKRYVEALAALQAVKKARVQRADLCVRLRRWEDARELYREALDLDPDNVSAHRVVPNRLSTKEFRCCG